MDIELITWDEEGQSQPAVAENLPDCAHVNWRLFSVCTHNCSYCQCLPHGDNYISLKDRMLDMAWKILSYPALTYHITISGGEPALHPALPDLLRYFFTSGRNVYVTLCTNGSLSTDYYAGILKGFPSGRLRVDIFAHPRFADLRNILLLIASISELGYLPHVRLVQTSGEDRMEKFLNVLAGLRKMVPFTFGITQACQQEPNKKNSQLQHMRKWRENALCQFASLANHGKALPQTIFNQLPADIEVKSVPPVHARTFGCPGAALLRIEPDGIFYNELCVHSKSHMPLWKANSIWEVEKVINCRKVNCRFVKKCPLPAFNRADNAINFINSGKKQRACLQWLLPPVRNPLIKEITGQDRFGIALQNHFMTMPAEKAGLKSDSASPIASRYADARAVYAFLEGKDNKASYLKSVCKALGDTRPVLPPTIPETEPGEMVLYSCEKSLSGEIRKRTGKNRSLLDITPFLSARDKKGVMDRLRKNGGFCSFLWINRYLPTDCLNVLETIIYNYYPRLQFSLADASLVDIPLWLRKKFPVYKPRIIPDESGCTLLVADAPYRELKKPLVQSDGPLASFILLATSNSVKDSISSILAQTSRDFEIIVLDATTEKNIRQFVEDRKTLIPQRLAYVPLPDNICAGSAWNTGLNMAEGKYAIFMNGGDLPGLSALEDAARIFESVPACEIVIFKSDAADLVEPGQTGILGRFLNGDLAGYGANGRIFSRSLLLRARARFAGSGRHNSLPFLLRAYHQALGVRFSASPFHISSNVAGDEAEEDVFAGFTLALSTLSGFFAANGLEEMAWDNIPYVDWLLKRDKAAIAREITKAKESDRIGEILSLHNLRRFGKFTQALRTVLAEASIMYCDGKDIPPCTMPVHMEETGGFIPSPERVRCHPVGNADMPLNEQPALSVIMSNCNNAARLKKTLESILDQSFTSFELVVVDDASADDSMEILQGYAALYTQIRLYAMSDNLRHGVCRNMGMGKALGKYIIFVDGADICLPGFFDSAVKAIDGEHADMVLFSSRYVDENGSRIGTNQLADRVYPVPLALQEYFKGAFETAPWAKIFRRDFIISAQCAFSEQAACQDEQFFYEALKKAGKIAARSAIVYEHAQWEKPVFDFEKTTWPDLQSSLSFMEFQQKTLDEWQKSKIMLGEAPYRKIRRHLENALFEKCAAYALAGKELPLNKAHYKRLSGLPAFLSELLRAYAVLLPRTTFSEAASPVIGLYEQPLVAVLIGQGHADSIRRNGERSFQLAGGLAKTLAIPRNYSLDAACMVAKNANHESGSAEQSLVFLAEQNTCPYFCVAAGEIPADFNFLEAVAWLRSMQDMDGVCFVAAKSPEKTEKKNIRILSGREWLDQNGHGDTGTKHISVFRNDYVRRVCREFPEYTEIFDEDLFLALASRLLVIYSDISPEDEPAAIQDGLARDAFDKSFTRLACLSSDKGGHKDRLDRQTVKILARLYAGRLKAALTTLRSLSCRPIFNDRQLEYVINHPEAIEALFENGTPEADNSFSVSADSRAGLTALAPVVSNITTQPRISFLLPLTCNNADLTSLIADIPDNIAKSLELIFWSDREIPGESYNALLYWLESHTGALYLTKNLAYEHVASSAFCLAHGEFFVAEKSFPDVLRIKEFVDMGRMYPDSDVIYLPEIPENAHIVAQDRKIPLEKYVITPIMLAGLLLNYKKSVLFNTKSGKGFSNCIEKGDWQIKLLRKASNLMAPKNFVENIIKQIKDARYRTDIKLSEALPVEQKKFALYSLLKSDSIFDMENMKSIMQKFLSCLI